MELAPSLDVLNHTRPFGWRLREEDAGVSLWEVEWKEEEEKGWPKVRSI